MRVTLFELPPPVELGGGWSLRFLTAARMLECRGEGEARAGEERDKALWANAVLLSRALLKEGEPAFPDGEAVLESLTAGQIEGLARRWWAQDDFSGRTVREEKVDREEWTGREGSENEGFDMARFLALAGAPERIPQDPAGEAFAAGAPAFPPVWPQGALSPQAPEAIQGPYREPYMAEGAVMPRRVRTALGSGLVIPLDPAGEAETAQGEHSALRVLLPQPAQDSPGLTVEELDAAVERDARRYDGGFTLY